jgi:hypothetical protein
MEHHAKQRLAALALTANVEGENWRLANAGINRTAHERGFCRFYPRLCDLSKKWGFSRISGK